MRAKKKVAKINRSMRLKTTFSVRALQFRTSIPMWCNSVFVTNSPKAADTRSNLVSLVLR